MNVSRSAVLACRRLVQGLEAGSGRSSPQLDILDIGVQDTGPDGSGWALRVRRGSGVVPDRLAMVWTLRGAPHFYRRPELAQVAAAVAPYGEADAAKRMFDAAKPLREAGISALEALDHVAARMREIVTEPMIKGDVSAALTSVLPDPYLRFCRACDTTHIYETPFRLGATRAGLELAPGTSPPVLTPSFDGPADEVPDHLEPVRAYLHFLGPATPKQVAGYIDAPVADVEARWPRDALELTVETEQGPQRRWMLAEDEEAVRDVGSSAITLLLAPFDLYLQAKDRELLVADPERRQELWPSLGRPGAILAGGELVGTWRARRSGKKLSVRLRPWTRLSTAVRQAIETETAMLAQFREAATVEVVDQG